MNPFLLDRMEAEGTAAILPGVIELNAWPRFQQLLAGRSIPLLQSNLHRVAGGEQQPLGARTLTVTVNGVRVGLIGVMSPQVLAKVRAPAGLELAIDDPVAVIQELAPRLRAECDIVAVMACMDDRDALAMAKGLSDVDLVLGGYQSIPSDRALQAGRVIVSRSGMRGQVLNTTRLIVSPAGEIVDWYGRNYPLAGDVSTDPVVDSLVAEVTRRAELALAHGIQAAVRSGTTTAPDEGAEPTGPLSRFVGAQVCGSCHSAQYQQWSSTAHARAFEGVAGHSGQGWPEGEIARRVTGYRVPGGYRPDRTTPDLRGVQCEACHGPASGHARGERARPIAEETCRGCHSPANSPRWAFGEALAKVQH